MTTGRVYAHVEGKELKSIVYFDMQNKRNKQIDFTHKHNGISPHTHEGFEFVNGEHPARRLTTKEKKLVAEVQRLWDDYLNG